MTSAPTPTISLYVGYRWIIPVKLVDTTTGQPLNITGWQIYGDLFLPSSMSVAPINLTAQNVDVSKASFQFQIPKSLTSGIAPFLRTVTSTICRIMVSYVDDGQDPVPLRPIFIQPLDPRTSTM